jgi:hypothetical protein
MILLFWRLGGGWLFDNHFNLLRSGRGYRPPSRSDWYVVHRLFGVFVVPIHSHQ